MISFFDEAQLELEGEVLSCGRESANERFKKFARYAKKKDE